MSDLNKNFLVKSASATLSGRNAFNERIDNIIRSTKGTHLFNRNFGFINNILFSNINDEEAYRLLLAIQNLLSIAMPEIMLDMTRSQCVPYPDQNYYLIQLYYSIISTNEQATYQNTLEAN